ncbi:MAG: lamin tail domain-containing protein, partial [Microbacteriaceae bacterium]|nr:lamin tail domain-containing protein [Microbacteriaceae bacterium]
DSQPADWVELYNPGTTSFDLAGFELRDNSDDHRWRFPAGAAIDSGEFLVVDENSAGLVYDDKTETWAEGLFREPIGIGGTDEIRLFNPAGELIDRTGAWSAHAAIGGDMAAATLARCVDGEGSFELAYATPGAPNTCVLPAVVINEVESNGDATDWVEIKNVGATAVDISGWTLMDNDPIGHAADVTPVAANTTLAAGDYFVFDQNRHFGFGLGGADQATVRNAHGQTVAEYAWTTHASGVYARCADGVGEFRDLEVSTKGLANACGNPVRINEVVTNPADWIELANPTDSPLDVSGIVVKDNDDSHAYEIPAGTTIAARGYHVIEADELGFGLGKADSVRLFEGEDLINETTWGPEHPLPSWGRCPDMSGSFAVTAQATKGAPNFCEGEFIAEVWPGAAETQVLDPGPMFLSDSSGLDSQLPADGTFLWAVDNGTGTFWKLAVAADGTVAYADGWAAGKRARFQKDASSPSAAGPDAEGITIDGDGFVYLAVERDNSAKGVNFNAVLKLDPNAAGPDVVASQEWDLTSLLPAVGANLGLEAIEWVADADLHGKLWDDNTGAPYDSADY